MTTTRVDPSATVQASSPIVVADCDLALAALAEMQATGQTMAFVCHGPELVGIVTAEDLGFAVDWAGRDAIVTDAVTLGIVEVARGTDIQGATDAYCEALRRWVVAHGTNDRPLAEAGRDRPSNVRT